MADVARRSLHKVTYAPIRPSAEDERSGAIERRRRGLEKIAFANALRASAAEIAATQRTLGDDEGGRQTSAALDAIAAASRGATARSAWRQLAATPAPALIAAGRALARHRRAQRGELDKLARALLADYANYVRRRALTAAAPPEVAAPPIRPPVAPTPVAPMGPSPAANPRGIVVLPPTTGPADNPWKPEPTSDPGFTAASLRPTFAAALDWARVSDPARADALAEIARRLAGIVSEPPILVGGYWDTLTDTVVSTAEDAEDWTDDLTDGFAERMKAEPVGRLHLERIDMTPVGVVRGELMHSVGLAPRETVTLIHREWSSRETSFEKIVTEEFEQSTEEGVTENTELASATETQSRHSSQLNTEATASGSYGFASGSLTVGYSTGSGDETAKRDSRNHSISVTRNAASRARKEHKVTFTVKEQAGVEDQSVRTLVNPSHTNPLRIDFHQLLRRWKVDLYRYGLRLTYDIVVPAPGIDLLAKVDELRRIDHQLAQPFTFSLKPTEITRAEWQDLAARYGAEIDAPDPEMQLLYRQVSFPLQSEDEAEKSRYDSLEFDIPDGYRVRRGEFAAWFRLYPNGFFDVMDDPPQPTHRDPEDPKDVDINYDYRSGLQHLVGRSGTVAAVMMSFNLRLGYAQATLEVAQTQEAWRAWQNRAWTAMRKAAAEAWQLQRHELSQRRDRLNEEIGQWDPLSLRRMEREEVMKTVLKWIFGPAFDLLPSEVVHPYTGEPGGLAALEPSRLTAAQWAQVMELGEFIKYLHQAIEWENVLFFVYPYFWDTPRNHALKRFLQHPDALHRAFLRGGAARVVLTVRPGFEESFTRLFEEASADADLVEDHPYLAIAEEIRNYAETHYPGIPGSDEGAEPGEDDIDEAERGERIARWYEYTPISALDITVNTPLDELR
jgi:hypothetical protein